jgi:hypothetical protein
VLLDVRALVALLGHDHVDPREEERGIGAGVLELEMWRLSASKENASPAQFELIHTEATNNWQLLRIFG